MEQEHMPESEKAYVEESKIKTYLLNESHPRGAGKARFFRSFGFTTEHWQDLARALTEQGRDGRVSGTSRTQTGNVQYEVDGPLRTPGGRSPTIRTVWERHESGGAYPEGLRLVTAFPGGTSNPKAPGGGDDH